MTQSITDHFSRSRIHSDNRKIRGIARDLNDHFAGRRVKLTTAKRGTHSRRRYNAGAEFLIYHVLVNGRDPSLWLSRLDSSPPSFEMAVWLGEVEFL